MRNGASVRDLVTPNPSARRLQTALGFAILSPHAPELHLLHQWLDTWPGIGAIVMGMRRQGWDLHLVGYGDGYWRATFWRTGTHPPVLGGSAWEAAPWTAVQRAARDAIARPAAL